MLKQSYNYYKTEYLVSQREDFFFSLFYVSTRRIEKEKIKSHRDWDLLLVRCGWCFVKILIAIERDKEKPREISINCLEQRENSKMSELTPEEVIGFYFFDFSFRGPLLSEYIIWVLCRYMCAIFVRNRIYGFVIFEFWPINCNWFWRIISIDNEGSENESLRNCVKHGGLHRNFHFTNIGKWSKCQAIDNKNNSSSNNDGE